MVASDQTDEAVVESLRAGASGFVAKDTDSKTLVGAVIRAREGRTVLDSAGQRALVAAVVTRPAASEVPAGLTDRQLQILKLMALGFRSKQIAGELGIADKTVRNQASLMYARLKVRDRAQAILYAVHKHLVSQPARTPVA
jgi:DNA-binding NarL/FixJ family response regulator